MAVAQTQGYSLREMWNSFRKEWPLDQGGNPQDIRLELPFTPKDSKVQRLLDREAVFLTEIKAIAQAPPDDAVYPSFADKVLSQAGVQNAGTVKSVPSSEFPGLST